MIIGIDPSLSSTAITINYDGTNFKYYSFTTGNGSNKWYSIFSKWFTISIHSFNFSKIYSKKEKEKIIEYEKLSLKIIEVIKNEILNYSPYNYRIRIEGFSYGSRGSNTLELALFGALLRRNLLCVDQELEIISPSTIKQKTCEMVYGYTMKKKKKVLVNDIGKSGGRFDKKDMLKALMDSNYNPDLKSKLIPYYNEIMSMKSIPSPLTDIIDSFWISLIK